MEHVQDTTEFAQANAYHYFGRACNAAAAAYGVVSPIAWNYPYFYGYNGAYVPMDGSPESNGPEVHCNFIFYKCV
jgi:hypothetical protein